MAITLCLQPSDARQHVLEARRKGMKIGLVPTMGALHRGHLSLVKASSSDCDYTTVTIFVNPIQFGPGEDFEKYPRNLDQDMELLEGLGVDMVFAPNPEDVFSPTHSTYVLPPKVAEPLEGELRPTHFRGVATIVLKLFQIIPADVAFFGQKDFQQSRVIQDMVADLSLPVAVQVCPIVRESDGLALSSRNAYLSDAERQQAVSISRGLRLAARMVQDGLTDANSIKDAVIAHLKQAGIERIEYVSLANPQTLKPVEVATAGTMALVAAYSGSTRLIDNVRLG